MARTPKPPKLKYYAGLNIFQGLIVTLFGAPLIVFLIIPLLLGAPPAQMVKPWIPAIVLAVVAFLAVTPQFWKLAISLTNRILSSGRADWDAYSDDKKFDEIRKVIMYVIFVPVFLFGMFIIGQISLWVVRKTGALIGTDDHLLVDVAGLGTLFGLIFVAAIFIKNADRSTIIMAQVDKFEDFLEDKLHPARRKADRMAPPVGTSQPTEKPRHVPRPSPTKEADFAFDPKAFKEPPAPKPSPKKRSATKPKGDGRHADDAALWEVVNDAGSTAEERKTALDLILEREAGRSQNKGQEND